MLKIIILAITNAFPNLSSAFVNNMALMFDHLFGSKTSGYQAAINSEVREAFQDSLSKGKLPDELRQFLQSPDSSGVRNLSNYISSQALLSHGMENTVAAQLRTYIANVVSQDPSVLSDSHADFTSSQRLQSELAVASQTPVESEDKQEPPSAQPSDGSVVSFLESRYSSTGQIMSNMDQKAKKDDVLPGKLNATDEAKAQKLIQAFERRN